jgi:hypothetical protein
MPAKTPVAAHQSLTPWIISVALVCLGVVAYCSSFPGPFIFDDLAAIRDNPDFGGASNLQYSSTTLTARPVLWFSFKVDYALAGQSVEAYHVTNLLIHLTAGLLLFGIVRRNLMRTQTWGKRFVDSAPWLAGAVAAIWLVHPLTTAAVTYIVQRAETLAAMFYLLVIYCLIRSADSGRAVVVWSAGTIIACALGIMTKETLATAPLIALIYDRTFLAGSFAAALKMRRWLYAGLAATWGILAVVVIQGQGRGNTIGFNLGISPIQYALTQLGVIAHYIRLVFWPRGLVLTATDWPVARHWNQVGAPGLLVALLLVATLVAFWKWPRLGFLLAWFFLILAPSSSIVPIVTEIEADHRAYLPLAGLVALGVVGGWLFAQRWHTTRLLIALAPCVIAILITLTILRNNDYQTPTRIWADNAAKRPNAWSAWSGYGQVLGVIALHCAPQSQEQKLAAARAVPVLRRAFELSPDKYLYLAALNLSTMLETAGYEQESERFDAQLIRQFPDRSAEMHRRRAEHRLDRRDLDGARADFEAAIAADPNDTEAHYYLGMIMQATRDYKSALAQYQRVLQLQPHYRDVDMRLWYLQTPRNGG